MHDKIIQILLVVQEVTKLPGHAFLDTGFLSTDDALQHHPTQPGANLKCLPTSSRKMCLTCKTRSLQAVLLSCKVTV